MVHRMTRQMALVTAVLAGALLGVPGTAAAMFTGVESVQRATDATSEDKTVAIACPVGKQVTSAGFEISPPDGRVLIDSIRPSSTLGSVRVTASEDEAGTADNWTLTAYAVCAPAPAGLQLVKLTSAASSAAKSVSAVCPSGKRVLGTGGEVTGAAGQLLIHRLTPSDTLDRVTMSAYEDETGTSGSWTLTAYAICASPAQPLVRRNRVSAYVSASPRFIDRPCNPGEVAVGMGGILNGAGNQLVLQALHPHLLLAGRDPGVIAAEDRTGYEGTWTPEAYTICAAALFNYWIQGPHSVEPTASRGVECDPGAVVAGTGASTDRGRGEAWLTDFGPQFHDEQTISVQWMSETARQATLRAEAFCATATGLPGYERFTTEDPDERPDAPIKTATAPCPAGKRVLSGASEFDTEESAGHITLQSVFPSADLTSVRVDGAETETGTPNNWYMWATAICAPPPPGLQRVSKTTGSDSAEYKVATAACPAGKHVIGTGALISPRTGEVVLDDIDADDKLTKVTVEAFEDYTGDTGNTGNWSLTAYAVCVNR